MLRTLEGRAQLAVLGLWVTVVASILDAYAHANRFRLVQEAVDSAVPGVPLSLPEAVIDRADTYVSVTLVVSTAVLLGSGVLWLLFQHAVHVRLADRMHGWRADPRAGVIAWLVPVANLLAPLLVVAALLRAAGTRSRVLLAAWWLCWIAAAVLAGFGTGNPEVLADQRTPDLLAITGDVVSVAGAVLAIGIVRRLVDHVANAPVADPPAAALA